MTNESASSKRGHWFSSRELLTSLAVIAAAVLVKLAYLLDYSRTALFPVMEYSDGHYYVLWARDIAAGDLIGTRVFMKWPLYAYFLGALSRISGEDLFFVYCVQILMSAFTCLLMYKLGLRLLSRAAGLIGVGLYLWYGMSSFYDCLPLYTSLALFLNILFCYVLVRIRDRQYGTRLFGAGLLAGLCVISQGNSFFFCLFSAALIVLTGPHVFRRKLGLLAGFVAGLMLVIGVVTSRNFAVSGDFVPVAGNMGINFYIGNNPEADGLFYTPADISVNQEGIFRDSKALARYDTKRFLRPSEVSSYWFDRGAAFVRAHPRAYARLLGKKLSVLFSMHEPLNDMEYTLTVHAVRVIGLLIPNLSLILPFGLLGMIMCVRRIRDIGVLYIGVLTFSLSLLVFFVTTRYRILYVPFMSLFAGAGIVSIIDSARQQRYRLCFIQYLLIISAFFAFNYIPEYTRARRLAEMVPVVQARVDRTVKLMEKGKINEALACADEARGLQPGHYIGSLMKGYVLLRTDNGAGAREALLGTVRDYPYCVYAYRYLGELYNKEGEFSLAQHALRRALFLDDDYAWAYYELGKAYRGALQLERASKVFEIALEKNGRSDMRLRSLILDELKNL